MKEHKHTQRHTLWSRPEDRQRETDIWPDPLMNKNKTQALCSAWRLIGFRRREGRQARKKEGGVRIKEGKGGQTARRTDSKGQREERR